tara:strand:+ start:157 stop:441 length:285 start_codon:yes stop_codon:yes gene_type:complete
MKQVIIRESINTIDIEDLKDNSVIGVQWGKEHKMYVVKTNQGYCITQLVEQSLKFQVFFQTKQELIEHTLKGKADKVFVFENTKELLNWLQETL